MCSDVIVKYKWEETDIAPIEIDSSRVVEGNTINKVFFTYNPCQILVDRLVV